VKATTYGTTRRAQWRKKNPTRLVRLRPESIYEFAKDRDDAIRLLKLYGYIT
jgi:predicted ATPase